MNDDFRNPYPDEFGFFRIGTPINTDINRANPDCPAFEMSSLAAKNYILMDVNPTSAKKIQGGGCDTKSQNASAFSTDSQVNIKWFVNASLSFHSNQSKNRATSKSTQTITAFAQQEMKICLRKNLTDKQLLKCATPGFREKLQRIRDEALARIESRDDGEKLRAAYSEFYKVYGTGFVSKLVLGAIGVFKGWASYESSASEVSTNFGGGASIKGTFGGASTAVEYCQKNMDLDA
ncbi:MAG: hypothetical protein PVF82_18080, partial [Gammaproteobacteria bacterium]